jgi:hypothetical protein
MEAWEELLGFGGEETIRAFVGALSKKDAYAGHLPCPCGSGRRVRGCHGDLLRDLRNSVYWEDAKADLFRLRSADERDPN